MKQINRHRQSNRLQERDYSKGSYAVTICTRDKKWFFGEILADKMILNDIGKLAHQLLLEVPRQFEKTELDTFIIMPNHIHAIIIIGKYWEFASIPRVNTSPPGSDQTSVTRGGATGLANPMLSTHSLSQMIRWYKGRCSFEIRKMVDVPYFAWQPRYYDQVIKSRKELELKRNYIKQNPVNWYTDDLNII